MADPKIYSFEVGAVKPDSKIYSENALKDYNKIIFIDDKESYLRTGIEQFGWCGILFTPFIDKAEAIRSTHNDTTKPKTNFKIADSVTELVESLRYFGVK